MRRTLLLAFRRGWREFVRELLDPYRPELHYMRGPGPKSAQKRALAASREGRDRASAERR